MIRAYITFLVGILLAISTSSQDLSYGLIANDLQAHPMQSLSKPAIYETVEDPSFGTQIRRITNASEGEIIKTMYSTVQAWNADESLIILYNQTQGVHILLDGNDYRFIRNIDNINPSDIEDIFWHYSDPDILLYVEKSTEQLIEYNVRTDSKTTLADLSTISNCNAGISLGNDIQMPSWDNSKIGFRCGNSNTYIYDITTETLVEVNVPDVNYTAAMPFPSGNLYFHNGAIYDSNGEYSRSLNVAGVEHSCLGKDANGMDTYFAISFAEGPQGSCLGDVIAHTANNANCTELIGTSIGYAYPQSGVHISSLAHKNTQGGWIAASMMGYDLDGQDLLDQELVIIKANLSDPKVYRIGHHRSSRSNFGYWGEPHPCISPSGTRVLFSSDWSGDEDGLSVDVYVVELPIHNLTTSLNTEIVMEEDGISIYPNPFTDQLYMELLSGNYTIRVLDVNGNVHATLSIEDKYTLSIPSLPSGLYFLEILKDNGSSICFRKIIKQ